MTAPIELMKVQLYTRPEPGLLGNGVLGQMILGPASMTLSWRDILCDAQRVSISRGGRPQGVTTSLDVGTLSIQLYNEGDPSVDPGIAPNVPIRVLVGATIVFTGNVEDVLSTYDKQGNIRVTITAADAVRSIASTMRYGVAGVSTMDGVEQWEPRINRLRDSLDAAISSTSPGTGSTKQVVVDGYGTKPGLEWTRFGTRPTGMAADDFTADAAGLKVATALQPFSTVITYLPRAFGVQRTISGLTVGRLYTVSVSTLYSDAQSNSPDDFRTYVLGVAGASSAAGWSEPTILRAARGGASYNPVFLRYSFVAAATSHIIQVARDYDGNNRSFTATSTNWWAENLNIGAVAVSGHLSTPVTDVVYETTLVNHFQMACDSVGAYWWVARDNVVKFARSLPATISAEFSDVHDAANPLHVCFLDLQMGYDTRNVVNTLTLRNHGRKDDPRLQFSTDYLADDIDETYVDTASRTAWGARSDAVHTSLPRAVMATRADQLLAASSSPSVSVSSITFSAVDHPAIAGLDLYSRISVQVRNHSANYRIVGIDHRGEPDSWTTTFTLRKD